MLGVERMTDSKEIESPLAVHHITDTGILGEGREVSTGLPTTTMYRNHLWTWRLCWETQPFDRLMHEKMACRNSARVLYSDSKVFRNFRSSVLLYFGPTPVQMRSLCPPRGLPLSGRRNWWEISGQNRFQGTADAQAFGVQIAHGGFERIVTHDLLNCPWIGAPFQTMGGITMPELMR